MKNFIICAVLLFIVACKESSQLEKDFNCNVVSYSNLETLKDFKKNFTINIPKNWKTSYYYDNVVSSIYTADTTLNLTKTTIIDATFVLNPVDFDDNFIQKIQNDNLNMGLVDVKTKSFIGEKGKIFYNLAKGKKTKYDYQILNVFMKAKDGFLHVKTEVYGDKLVEERLCKSISLINQIELQ